MQAKVLHPTLDQLKQYLLGKLGEVDSASLEKHLEGCAKCKEAARTNKPSDTLVELLRQWTVKTAPGPTHVPATVSYRPAGAATTELPERFGRYRIVKCLGKGGMGAVYLARDTKLDRDVALKVPQIQPDDSPEVLERFRREAQAMGEFRHPNLCPIYDVDEIDGVHFYTMPSIAGISLSDWIHKHGVPTQKQVAGLIRKLALALFEAHRHGVVHRDLKPANIMIEKTARGSHEPVIIDFGLARRDKGMGSRLTRTGAPMGTPAYMPPEQLKGQIDKMGAACDIYSLGVTMFELLTGRLPFEKSNWVTLTEEILHSPPPPPQAICPDVEPRLAEICLRCLAKKPEERYASMRDLAADLESFMRARPSAPAAPKNSVEEIFAELAASTDQPGQTPPGVTRQRRSAWVAAAAAIFGLVFIAGVVLYVATDYGTIKIELSDPKADVQIKVDGNVVTLSVPDGTLTLKAGPHAMEITSAKIHAVAKSFTVRRGTNEPIRIPLEPRVAAAPILPAVDPAKQKAPAGAEAIAAPAPVPADTPTSVMYGTAGDTVEESVLFEIRGFAGLKPELKVMRKVSGFMHDIAVSDAGVVYGVGNYAPSSIFRINPATGAVESNEFPGFANSQTSLAWSPGNVFFSGAWNSGEVLRSDLNTKKTSVVAKLPADVSGITDMAWDPTNGSLYVLAIGGTLFHFKTEDGTLSRIGKTPLWAIAIDGTGQMYATAAGATQGTTLKYYKVDKKTCAMTLLADFSALGLGTGGNLASMGLGVGPAAGAAPAKTSGFVDLFNGKNLTGWFVDGPEPDLWNIDGAELVSPGSATDGYSLLLTERSFRDFILRFEFQLSKGARSGVVFRAIPGEKPWAGLPFPLTVCLRDDSNNPVKTGALLVQADGVAFVPPLRAGQLKPLGSWNTMELEVRGQQLRVALNGDEIQRASLDKVLDLPNPLPALKRSNGRIGFQRFIGEARFRNIRIKLLNDEGK